MTEENIKKLLKDLFDKKFTKNFSHTSDTYKNFAIDESARSFIENIIRNHLADDRDEKLGILEAKVFMYEQIISKSNFAPMLQKNSISETPKIPGTRYAVGTENEYTIYEGDKKKYYKNEKH